MTDEREIKQEDLHKHVNLFGSRISNKSLDFGDTTFIIAAIPSVVMAKITDDNTERFDFKRANFLMEVFRYGVIDILNLTDQDGNLIKFQTDTVKIGGKFRKRVSEGITEGLPVELIQRLAGEIAMLNSLTKEDRERLGFTTASLPESNASDTTTETNSTESDPASATAES